MKKIRILALVLSSAFIFNSNPSFACDLCSLNNTHNQEKLAAGRFSINLNQQFTEYSTIQMQSKKIANEHDQYLHSSITQFSFNYAPSDLLTLEMSLPFIDRSYRRLEDDLGKKGSASGLGDLSLLLRVNAFENSNNTFSNFIQFFGGIKLPTGDSQRLKEEQEEGHHHEDEEEDEDHDEHEHDHVSVVHGHDLALGSGSWDIPFGLTARAQHDQIFVQAKVEYTIRNQGDYNYRYANDLHIGISPGIYLMSSHQNNLAFKLNLNAEHKTNDVNAGVKADDTAFRNIFFGPEISGVINNKVALSLALDLPLDSNNSQTQIVADYRIKAGVSLKF